AVSVSDKTLYFCPSPLYGYGLDRLLARFEKEAPNSALLCVEADSELYELNKKNIDPSLAANKKLHITNICESKDLCAIVRKTWGVRVFRRIETVRFTGGWQLFPELYETLCQAIRREIVTDWSNALTLAKLGRLYMRNALRNLFLIPRFPSITKLSFGESPVLVLGAGPSLDEILEYLERRFTQTLRRPESRSFKIICVDTCLGTLRDRNIPPDLVVILESQHWNLGDFIGCRGWNIPMAMDISALPQSEEMLAGEGFLFMTPWTPLRIFERLKGAGLLPGVIPPLGSVGLSAVELARHLSRGKIICAGLDFSFTVDKYHARSTPGHRSRLDKQSRFCGFFNTAAYEASFAVHSKSNIPVRSNPAMQNYRSLFEREFAADSRLFDIAGSGLHLGLKTLSPQDALEILASFPQRDDITAEQKRENQFSLTEKLLFFIHDEKDRLEKLKNILTGAAAAEKTQLDTLIDECDYLWAHFPDYSGGLRPDLSDSSAEDSADRLSFLKRLRAEIDPVLKIYSCCGV
ncbi:MAG: DUF115 domain-containing protein, partial [Treponema sp.]|nr:DUF115 domain-containing protein [Treponema sp.]